MTKKPRPSLKDYIRTGEVRLEPLDVSKNAAPEPSGPEPEKTPVVPTPSPLPTAAEELLSLLSESDRIMWGPILKAGVEIQVRPLDYPALREDFRTMDRERCTCYLLEKKGEPLRPVRTSVQIREPAVLMFKWDETGILWLYGPTA